MFLYLHLTYSIKWNLFIFLHFVLALLLQNVTLDLFWFLFKLKDLNLEDAYQLFDSTSESSDSYIPVMLTVIAATDQQHGKSFIFQMSVILQVKKSAAQHVTPEHPGIFTHPGIRLTTRKQKKNPLQVRTKVKSSQLNFIHVALSYKSS